MVQVSYHVIHHWGGCLIWGGPVDRTNQALCISLKYQGSWGAHSSSDAHLVADTPAWPIRDPLNSDPTHVSGFPHHQMTKCLSRSESLEIVQEGEGHRDQGPVPWKHQRENLIAILPFPSKDTHNPFVGINPKELPLYMILCWYKLFRKLPLISFILKL